MNRRDFLIRSALLAAGGFVSAASPALAETAAKAAAAAGAAKAAGGQFSFDSDIYSQFRNPDIRYRPFARWWWNGNKVEAYELVRELRLLKEANIGGVEIYPVGLPEDTDDAGIPTLKWLSDEWIDMVKVTLDEADRLGMTCDLMVGTGWPLRRRFRAARRPGAGSGGRCGETHRPHRVRNLGLQHFQTGRPGSDDARRQPHVRVAVALAGTRPALLARPGQGPLRPKKTTT